MVQVLHQWLFFLTIVGSVIFFVIRFSRLAQAHGKNKWIFGFVGAASFLGTVRILVVLTTALSFNPEQYPYIFAYSMLMFSFLIAYGGYYLLKRSWMKAG